ncbi:zinc-binding dehydrogenase [Nonomuraea sp. NBC_01738]|uniref:zinc-binding dehydrogenase n=1 Tax=Nonomuraea sp. NBC_01738 TaxID=2976003 RepID=UPI002E1290B1
MQLAAAAGAHVIGAARGAGKADLVTSLGAARYVDYSLPGWLDQVAEATGGAGVDLVFDGVGGRIGTEAIGALRDGGRASIYGMASGADAELDEDALRARSVELIGLTAAPSPAAARALIADALALAAAGELRPVVGQIRPLEEAADAHRAIESRATVGKSLLRVHR